MIKAGLGAPFLLNAAGHLSAAAGAVEAVSSVHRLALDAAIAPSPPITDFLHMGTATDPSGLKLGADSRSLLFNGQRRLPVIGEFHYSRYPVAEWREALLRMRAGGINYVSSYVFWIHQEEIQGQWDWSGRRDLRSFVQTCQEIGMPLLVRCGPWCHGEVRNGGFPNWLQHSGVKLRSTDPAFLLLARGLYEQIAKQLQGLLWKDGGPVFAIQLDNEYTGPAEYLMALKQIAIQCGIDVPFYTRTGWTKLTTPMPLGEITPMFGIYPDGFWSRSLTTMPNPFDGGYCFALPADTTEAGIVTAASQNHPAVPGDPVGPYPYLCCEIGGGMETSYSRRIRIFPKDVLSIAMVKIGSGNNLQGYYMYHGGTNPDGKLTHLQETQATGGYNDLPVKTYDFFAPLGEFDQVHPHYHLLRRMHLFLADWGPLLADLPARLPQVIPSSPKDAQTLRWSVRTDESSGILFVNNYQRFQPMPAKPNVQFQIQRKTGPLTFPASPITVPADLSFFWPFDLDLAGVTLAYATAQPICRLKEGKSHYFLFAQTPGVPAEFVFEEGSGRITHAQGTVTRSQSRLHAADTKPGSGAAISLVSDTGEQIHIVLLDEAQSLRCWKGSISGQERVLLTPADVIFDQETFSLRAADPADFSVSFLPPVSAIEHHGKKLASASDGLFSRFDLPVSSPPLVPVTSQSIQPAGPPRVVPIGQAGVAAEPTDADFAQAAVWRLALPPETDSERDLILRIDYLGDAARIYLNGHLLDDNFYNGTAFELGLRRCGPAIYSGELLLKILPLHQGAPIYLQKWPEFGPSETVCQLQSVDTYERQTVSLRVV